jgi:very-short-patch-repair endonuclease
MTPGNRGSPAAPAPRRRADFERAAIDLAARQHGVVTRAQLLELGLSPGAVGRRLKAGLLTRLHGGVYRVGPPVAPRMRAMAAVLACGDRAFLSHASAADLHGIPRGRGKLRVVHVTVEGRTVRRPGILTHRVRILPVDETTRVERLPATTPARTIVDLARSLATRTLERAVAEAMARRGTTQAELLALAERHRRREGVARIQAMFGGGASPARTRSRAEEVFFQLVSDAGLPRPQTNVGIGRYEVDVLFRAQRLVVEIDGFTYHASPGSFEADRRRDGELTDAGYTVIRITWRQLQDEPLVVLRRLVQALERGERRKATQGR